jgi:hypothetical protein
VIPKPQKQVIVPQKHCSVEYSPKSKSQRASNVRQKRKNVDYAHSSIGYKYIPYGGLGLQALWWWFERDGDLPVNYELIQLQPRAIKKAPTTHLMDDPPQLLFDEDLLVYIPGNFDLMQFMTLDILWECHLVTNKNSTS